MPDSPATPIGDNDQDPLAWLEEHGDCLFRYALFRVKRTEVAEDLVQETFLAALHSADRFSGKSSRRTWLVGILKNKIFDYYRTLGREQSFTDLKFMADDDGRFEADGHWSDEGAPRNWQNTGVEALDKAAFWETLTQCLDKLPKRVANVFLLREMEERSTEEICSSLSLSPNNLWVMLHRARSALRICLEDNWFSPGDKP